MLSLAQRLAARLEELDDWDDGGGIILDREAGGRITSYTGTHAWNAGAGHVGPPPGPMLRIVRDEIRRQFASIPSKRQAALRDVFIARLNAFDQNPSMRSLIAFAEVVDRVQPLYASANPSYGIDAAADIVERGFGGYDDD